jgi:hypothetical protein
VGLALTRAGDDLAAQATDTADADPHAARQIDGLGDDVVREGGVYRAVSRSRVRTVAVRHDRGRVRVRSVAVRRMDDLVAGERDDDVPPGAIEVAHRDAHDGALAEVDRPDPPAGPAERVEPHAQLIGEPPRERRGIDRFG